MFKNRSIQIKLVKDAQTSTQEEAPTFPAVTPEEISHLAKGLVKYTAMVGAAVMGTVYVLKTLNEIAVIAAESNINKKD